MTEPHVHQWIMAFDADRWECEECDEKVTGMEIVESALPLDDAGIGVTLNLIVQARAQG